jgi:hypothetical protein
LVIPVVPEELNTEPFERNARDEDALDTVEDVFDPEAMNGDGAFSLKRNATHWPTAD